MNELVKLIESKPDGKLYFNAAALCDRLREMGFAIREGQGHLPGHSNAAIAKVVSALGADSLVKLRLSLLEADAAHAVLPAELQKTVSERIAEHDRAARGAGKKTWNTGTVDEITETIRRNSFSQRRSK